MGSSRNLPIRGVSDSASQRAQAQDQAETSASTPRNLPIREVSDSASQRPQDQEVRYQQAIEMSDEVTRCLTNAERDLAYHQTIYFVFHPTPLQAATSRMLHQDQATLSAEMEMTRTTLEMARTPLLRGTSTSAWESLQIAQAQRYVELQVRLLNHEDDLNAIRQNAQQSRIDRLTPLEKEVFSRHVCSYCNHHGHIKECCPQRYPVKTPAQIPPTARGHGTSTPVFSSDFPVPDINAQDGHAVRIAQLSEMISTTLCIMSGSTGGPSGT
jgi:hypothetical protein